MSLISGIFGKPSAPQGLPAAQDPSAVPQAIPGGVSVDPTYGVGDPSYNTGVPTAYGQDAYAPTYVVPTHVPSLIPGGLAGYMANEKMPTSVSYRQVRVPKTETYEVPVRTRVRPQPVEPAPVEEPIDAPVADEQAVASTTARSTRAAQSAETLDATGTSTGEEVASTARTASRTRAAQSSVAAEEQVPQTVTKTRTVMETKTQATAKSTFSSAGLGSVVKSSVLWSGGISLALNLYSLAKGQESVADAGSNVVGDVASGAVSGVGGALASTFGTAAIVSLAGGAIASFPVGLISLGLGIGGYWLTDHFFRKTNFFNSIKNDVHQLLGGGPDPSYVPPAPQVPTTGYPVQNGSYPVQNSGYPTQNSSTPQLPALPITQTGTPFGTP